MYSMPIIWLISMVESCDVFLLLPAQYCILRRLQSIYHTNVTQYLCRMGTLEISFRPHQEDESN